MRNLIPHFIQEEYKKERFEGNFEALTMFVDVSGFTPITQTLMNQGHEGAEILAKIMNGIFDLLIDAVYERGGFVSVFAGDAFTAIFPIGGDVIPADEFVLHVFACVGKIQSVFLRHGIQTTPYGQFPLQFKVGLSGGTVNWGIVGKTEKTFFFRGEAIDGCAISEHQADKGDIIFDEQVAQAIRKAPRIAGSAWNSSRLQGRYYRLHDIPKATDQLKCPRLTRSPRSSKKVVSRFFPEALIDLTEIGEFRHVVSIFISFDGISTYNELHDWTCVVLANIKTFGGYFHRMNFGDKGGFVLCGFGAPVTFENLIDRALDFLLAVKKDLKGFKNLSGLRYRAGTTYGIAYAGIAGGEKRCEYTYHGEVVNLAARMMMQAEWGEIFVSETVASRAPKFNFAYQGDFTYKGIADPVPTYTLIGRKFGTVGRIFSEPMIGRRTELQQLQDFASPIFEHRFAGMAYIYGEAGIGKSRLAYALHEEFITHSSIDWFTCPADQILRKPFNPFITFFMRYFEQSSESSEAKNRARFEEEYDALLDYCCREKCRVLSDVPGRLEEHVNELIRTKSIIGALLGLSWPDSLWEHLDAKGKYNNTLYTIKNFFLVHSLLSPVVIELEDGQWIDSDSLAVLKVLTRNIANYPILILSSLRYNDDGTKTTFQLEGVREQHIELKDLSATEVKHYAEAELNGVISDVLHTLLVEKTNGNPFFVQQLTRYFVENEVVVLRDDTWHVTAGTLALPDTINTVLMARIDRLANQVKEVVKAAAVIGQEFDLILLSAILKEDVFSQVQIVRKAQIWEEVQELHYMFKHALLRDIAYQMQLKSHLRELHQLVAETMETLYATDPAKRYADLAFHYEQAEMREKAIEYLEKAADEAKVQYHHYRALELYDRLLIQLQYVLSLPEREIDTLLKKGEIFELIGQWKACRQVGEEALRLSKQLGDTQRMGQAHRALGLIFRLTGEYEEAMVHYRKSRELFHMVGDHAGISYTIGNTGDVYRMQGDYDTAMRCYKKWLIVSKKLGDKRGISEALHYLGSVHKEKGDYNEAMVCYVKKLKISKELGDKVGISRAFGKMGIIYREKGDYDTAMACFKKDLKICEELGDQAGLSYVFGNMGTVYYNRGDYDAAMMCHEKKLKISKELENKRGISEALRYMGVVYNEKGDYDAAMECYEKQLKICSELGDKKGISRAIGNIGVVCWGKGDYDAAMECYKMDLKICEELGDQAGISYIVGKMGNVHYKLGDYDAAIRGYEKKLSICNELGHKKGVSQAMDNIGVIYGEKGDYDAAMACYEKSLEISEELGDKKGISLAFHHMGVVYREKGDDERAIAYYEQAIVIAKEIGFKYLWSGCLIDKANVFFSRQNFEEAQKMNDEGLKIAKGVWPDYIFMGNVLSAKIDFALGHREKAVALLSEKLEQTKDKIEQADLHYELYQCGVECENHRKEALRLYQELSSKTPKFEWKKRVAKLKIAP
jgi:tetratricopeptide (TPR) repeat protein/class 3 adenylate cyclase